MKAVVLVSGGLDSTTLLHHVVKRLGAEPVYALGCRYGQKHARELDMARWQCAQLPAVREWRVVDLPVGELTQGASALTDTAIAVPDLAAIAPDQRRQPPTYVPNRNMILLAVAAAYAESRGCGAVFYGAQTADAYGYWDCTAEFVERLNAVLNLNRREPVTIQAPFLELRKAQILQLGFELGVDYAHTWSCYRGQDQACGRCPTCVERRAAFPELGRPDQLPYAG